MSGVEAHTRFFELFINGQGQGDAVGIRMDLDSSTTEAPIADVTSTDMVCGKGGLVSVGRTLTATAGDELALLHRKWPDGSQAGVIDDNHKGPVSVYMKKIADAGATDPWTVSDGSGAGWFKISWDGYVLAQNKWGVDDMIANGGYTTATIPSDVAAGYYLVRSEVMSLQNWDGGHVNPQFFIGCAQVYVEGTGAATPETVSIPGYVDLSTPSLLYDIYATPMTEFPTFGPAVYQSSAVDTSTLNLKLNAVVAADAVVGQCSSTTVLQVGNNCYEEIASWTGDTAGSLPKCWAASDSCWATNTKCWASYEPTINGADSSQGCNLWQTKCNNLVDWCNAGNTYGPPNAGTVLTAVLDTTSVVSTYKAKRAARELRAQRSRQ